MNYTGENKERLIAFFEAGKTPPNQRKMGLELEHIIVSKGTGKTVGYYDTKGIEYILQELSSYYENTTSYQQHMIGLERENNIVTLEPAGQFEIALRPTASIETAAKLYTSVLRELEPILEALDYQMLNIGYHPKNNAREMPLIPKKRYQFMDQYFKTTGHHGIDMMRGSASTQVSLDYIDEEDFINIFRLGNILCPLLALLTDNTPYFMGRPYNGYLARTVVWNDVDADRAMVVKDALNQPFGFREYADYILNSPAILILDEEGTPKYTGATPIKELYKDRPMTEAEIIHVLSMFFPDVRLKTYAEIRMADSMPLPYALAYLALLKGLFYSNKNKTELLEQFQGIQDKDVKEAKETLIANGYRSNIYGKTPKTLLLDLLNRAKEALAEAEKDYLRPFFDLVTEETTLAKSYNDSFA